MSLSLFRHDGGVSFSPATTSTLYEPLIASKSSSVGYYEPLSSKSTLSSKSSQELSERDHIASFECATKLNECCKRHDWIGFGSLLSPFEIDKGINELQSKYDKEITPQTYVSVFIPRLMKSNRGRYNNLVEFEFKREIIFSNLEVAFVFNYIYKNKQENGIGNGNHLTQVKFEEEEVLWVTRESTNHCWKVQFSGTPVQTMNAQCCIIL